MRACEYIYTYIYVIEKEGKNGERKKRGKRDKDGRIAFGLSIVHFGYVRTFVRGALFEIVACHTASERFALLLEWDGTTGHIRDRKEHPRL